MSHPHSAYVSSSREASPIEGGSNCEESHKRSGSVAGLRSPRPVGDLARAGDDLPIVGDEDGNRVLPGQSLDLSPARGLVEDRGERFPAQAANDLRVMARLL